MIDLLRHELQSLLSTEKALAVALGSLEPRARHRRIAIAIRNMAWAARSHKNDLERHLVLEGWPTDGCESLVARSWGEELAAETVGEKPCPEIDGVLLCSLHQAIHIKLPLYEIAVRAATRVERPALVASLRMALSDEEDCLLKLSALWESGSASEVTFATL